MKKKKPDDKIDTLEEKIGKAAELFGVDSEILTSAVNHKIIQASIDRIRTAIITVLDSSVAGEFALAGIDFQRESLPPVLDYTFLIRKYTELIDFADQVTDNLGATAPFARKSVSERIREEMRHLEDSEQKYTTAVKEAKTGAREKALSTALLKIQEYSGTLEQALSRWGIDDEKAKQIAGSKKISSGGKPRAGVTIEKRVKSRPITEETVRRDEPGESNQITYFSIRGKRFYSAPAAAQLLGINYGKLNYNLIPPDTLVESERESKVRVVKREKGQATKVYREDALVDLLPDKLREGIDLKERLRKTTQQEYSGKIKVQKLADIGVSIVESVEEKYPRASGKQEEEKPADESRDKAERTGVRRKRRTVDKITQKEDASDRAARTSLPDELLPIFNVEGLEQTVEGAEDLFFLAVNRARFFPVREIRKVYEGRKYGEIQIAEGSYSGLIALHKDEFTEGSLLKVKALFAPEGTVIKRETYFVREDKVQLTLPKYVDDKFTGLIQKYSLQPYPLNLLDADSLIAEVKKYGLDQQPTERSKPIGKARRNGVTAEEQVGTSVTLSSTGAERGLEATLGVAPPQVEAPVPSVQEELIPYEDLPARLGGKYNMGKINAACKVLADDSQITLHQMIPELGDDSPKGIKAKHLEDLRAYLTANI